MPRPVGRTDRSYHPEFGGSTPPTVSTVADPPLGTDLAAIGRSRCDSCGAASDRPVRRVPGVAACYTPARPRHERVSPYQEVNDRAFMAHRSSREASERPVRCGRHAGEVYPRHRSGVFDFGAAPWTAGACVGRLRQSLTHLGVRSLLCSPSAFAATAQGADSPFAVRLRRDRPGRRFSVRRPPSPRSPTAPILSSWIVADAGYGDRGAAVGRRGQGQDDRLPGRAGRDGRALPGWRQRRAYGHQRGRGPQAAADPVGRALPAHHLGHRQRRRRQPADPDRRVRHAGLARDRRLARARQPQLARDHAVPRRPRRRQ